MTHASISPRVSFAPEAGWFSNLRQRLQAHRERMRAFDRTYRELAGMTDRELADIGVSRSQVRDIALAAANAA